MQRSYHVLKDIDNINNTIQSNTCTQTVMVQRDKMLAITNVWQNNSAEVTKKCTSERNGQFGNTIIKLSAKEWNICFDSSITVREVQFPQYQQFTCFPINYHGYSMVYVFYTQFACIIHYCTV